VDALVSSGAAKSRVIDVVIAIEIRECKELSVAEETFRFGRLSTRRCRKRAGADSGDRQNGYLDKRYVLRKSAALAHRLQTIALRSLDGQYERQESIWEERPRLAIEKPLKNEN